MSFEKWRDDYNRNNDTGYTGRDEYQAGFLEGQKIPKGYRLVKITVIIGNPNVDWSLAPKWAKYWVFDRATNKFWWSKKRPKFSNRFNTWIWKDKDVDDCLEAPSFGYDSGSKESMTYRKHMEN